MGILSLEAAATAAAVEEELRDVAVRGADQQVQAITCMSICRTSAGDSLVIMRQFVLIKPMSPATPGRPGAADGRGHRSASFR